MTMVPAGPTSQQTSRDGAAPAVNATETPVDCSCQLVPRSIDRATCPAGRIRQRTVASGDTISGGVAATLARPPTPPPRPPPPEAARAPTTASTFAGAPVSANLLVVVTVSAPGRVGTGATPAGSCPPFACGIAAASLVSGGCGAGEDGRCAAAILARSSVLVST